MMILYTSMHFVRVGYTDMMILQKQKNKKTTNQITVYNDN